MISKTLHGAADAVEYYGWIQKSMGAKYTGMCMLGGMKEALGILNYGEVCAMSSSDMHESFSEYGSAVKYAESALGNVAGWNDRAGRTKEEVVAKLRELGDQAMDEGL